MDERMTRLWAGSEAEAIGRGGLAAVSRATGLALNTVKRGRNELRAGAKTDDLVNVRRKGGGGRKHEDRHPELIPALKKLVDPATRGDPESALRWSAKSAEDGEDEKAAEAWRDELARRAEEVREGRVQLVDGA